MRCLSTDIAWLQEATALNGAASGGDNRKSIAGDVNDNNSIRWLSATTYRKLTRTTSPGCKELTGRVRHEG